MRKLSHIILLAAGLLVIPLFGYATDNAAFDQPFPHGFYPDGRSVKQVFTQTQKVEPKKTASGRDRFKRPGMLYSIPSHRIDVIALQERFTSRSVFEYLRFVPGVWVTGGFYSQRVQIRGGSNVLYLLDGMRVDAGTIQSLNPWDVDFIDVLKGPRASIYGGLASNGVIAVYTRLGPVEPRNRGFHTPHLIRPAFTTVNELESPILPKDANEAVRDASDYYGELVRNSVRISR